MIFALSCGLPQKRKGESMETISAPVQMLIADKLNSSKKIKASDN
jgi:hypothetical protein